MRYRWQAYERPKSVEQALDMLRAYKGQAVLIAGGTDLVVDLDREDRVLPAVIDISRIESLRQIEKDGNYWQIGAAVTLTQVLQHEALAQFAPHLMEAVEQIGSVQIRNAATLVGNVTNASPAADAVLPLLTMDAEVVIAGADGQRFMPLQGLFLGPRSIACDSEEIVVALRLPISEATWLGAFEKLGLRQAMAIAIVNVAANVAWDGEVVRKARLAVGASAPTPILVEQAAQAMIGTRLEQDVIERVCKLAQEATHPIDDLRASASYRRKMVKALSLRCLERIRRQWQNHSVDA